MVQAQRDVSVEAPGDDQPAQHDQVMSALEIARITRAAALSAEADRHEAALYSVAMMSLVVAEQLLARASLDAAMRHAERATAQFLASAQRAAQRAAR